jgi:arabinose-5-phosphate isomerase
MFHKDIVLRHALETIQLEADSVIKLKEHIDAQFIIAVRTIHESKGRTIVSGIGKSAVIAQKMVSTFNSTGTPAVFMHAADAIHGDLGMVQPNDVVIIVSKSGDSEEIKVLLPYIKNLGNRIIAICGNATSYLVTHADVFINSTVDKEACPHNLAPTNSTTVQLVIGDALAMCLLQLKGFTEKDFERFHPGGATGKRLYLLVSDMSDMNEQPAVKPNASLKEISNEISEKRLGATVVLGDKGEIQGIITDGDLRRMLEKHDNPAHLRARDILIADPKSIDGKELATEALALIRRYDIAQLVVTKEGKYAGMLHLHDLVREGII